MSSEIDILRVIAKGHPERKVTATTNGQSRQVSGLTWDEIKVAVHATLEQVAEPIARLVQKKLIDSGREYPTFFGRLTGKSETTYFWITPAGVATLSSIAHQKPSTAIDKDDVVDVDHKLAELGFHLTNYGVDVTLLSLQSGYSNAETASHIALATIARDVRDADLDTILAIAVHARSMLGVLKGFAEDGSMREEFFKNDGRALVKVVTPSPEQKEWIDRVLSDEMVAKERVAHHQDNYGLPL